MKLVLQHSLIKGWRKCPRRPPYLFPGDTHVLKGRNQKRRERLDFNAVPAPYTGNLAKAHIYILMNNPGLTGRDYSQSRKLRKARFNTLRQNFSRYDFPFRSLDPQHKGSDYWKNKFNEIIEAIAEKYKNHHDDATRYLADRVVCLNLLPYHSRSRPSLRHLKDLPSVQTMLDFVCFADLIERAKRGKALVIVVRYKKYWGKALDLEGHCENVVVYNPKTQARGASFGLTSPGGKAIVRYLGL